MPTDSDIDIKTLAVGINRGLSANVGTGTGSQTGWIYYIYGDVDLAGSVGIVFLQNGHLVLTFVLDGVPKYSINQMFGERDHWSAPATITPAISMILSGQREQGQTYRFYTA